MMPIFMTENEFKKEQGEHRNHCMEIKQLNKNISDNETPSNTFDMGPILTALKKQC